MSLEEFEKKPDRMTQRYLLRRSIADVGMGIIYLAVGGILLFAKQLNFRNESLTSLPVKIFAGVIVIYGGWRIYRGIKKDYFKGQ